MTTRLAIHRWPQSLGLVLAGVVLGAPVVGLTTTHQSGVRAIEESVRAEFGYADGWKLQASEAASSAVAKAPGVTAVRVDTTSIATPSARADAVIWTLDNALAPLGLVLEGRRARAPGEASVSEHLAETLDLRLGSTIVVGWNEGPTDLEVVGITGDPADRDSDLVIDVASQMSSDVTYWIAPEVSEELDFTPGLTASGVAGTTETRLDRQPGGLRAVAQALPVTVLVTILVMLASVAAQLPGALRDVAALRAAGMSESRAWRVVGCWISALVCLGAALGALIAVAGLHAASDQVSSAFGQRWTRVSPPATPIVLVVVLPLLLAFVPMGRLNAIVAWSRREGRDGLGTGRVAVVGGAAAAAAGVGLLALGLLGARDSVQVSNPELLGLLGIIGITVGVRVASNGLVGLGRGRSTRALTRRLASQLTVGTCAALVVGTTCAGYAAWHTHNANALDARSTDPQAPGSYLIYQAPAPVAEQILSRYEAAGGTRSFVYNLPDETHSSVRATTEGVVDCLGGGAVSDSQLGLCLQREGGAMSFPALDPQLPSDVVLVDEVLLDTSDRVGLVAFGESGVEITNTEVVSAVGSSDLGGNMPGLVTAPTNELAKRYGLVASGLVEFGMLDFGGLRPRDAAQIRGLVASLAPAAQSIDSTSDTSREETYAISLFVALFGAALALIIQLTTCASVVSGARQTRLAIAAAGIVQRQRLAVSLRVVGPAFVGILVGAALVVVGAPRLGVLGSGDIGWSWSFPIIAQAVALVLFSLGLLRAPRR